MTFSEADLADPLRLTRHSAVRVEGVTKIFTTRSGQTIALEGIDLEVAVGEFVAIVGPSGCGKSTILKMLAGLISPSRGVIRVFGEAQSGPPPSLGVAFQQDLLLPWRTVLENVLLQTVLSKGGGDRAALEGQARELLAAAGLEGFEHRMPRELSGGMRQRVALCRALLGEPNLLLLDEPFASLDAITRDQMGLDLQHLWLRRSPTVVFVTHSIPEAVFLADRVIVLSARPGRVEEAVTIDWPRPRTIDDRDAEICVSAIRKIRALFEAQGLYRERPEPGSLDEDG